MITKRQQEALYALLDQAAANGGTLDDLAKRIGSRSPANAHAIVAGLKARGIYRSHPRPIFSAAAFRFVRVEDLPAPET